MTRYPCGDAADGVPSDQRRVLPAAYGCASVTQPSPAVILQLRSAASASRDSILREAGYRVIQTESREDLWRLLHRLNANSRRGSRRNIAFHYDLGNDFYRLWLDPTMTYSSALFASPEQSLEQAQRNKYQTISHMLGIKDGDRVLEIGCGWGGMAEHLLSQQDVSWHGITLSQQQLLWCQQRLTGFAGEPAARP